MTPDPVLQAQVPAPPPHKRSAALLRIATPGVIVAVAYVDPGNFATNVQAGAALGSRLLWVVLVASAVAVLVQYLAAKLGAVTGQSLPELCREHYARPVALALWVAAEVVAMATDFVEIVGGAIALQLLWHVPLALGGVLVGLAGTSLLLLRPGGRGRFQTIIGLLLAVVVGCFLLAAWRVGISGDDVWSGLAPSFGNADTGTTLLLASGIVGATVMPHAIYVHSALAGEDGLSDAGGTIARLRRHRLDIAVSLGVATIANAALLLVAASALYVPQIAGAPIVEAAVSSLQDAYAALRLSDPVLATTFVVALLFAGLAASCVGTYAGDVVMQGFLRRRVPVVLRRAATLAPTLVLLGTGVDPTRMLVLSQVVLSFGLPAALLPLVLLTSRRAVMGVHANSRLIASVASVACASVCALNLGVLVTTV